MFKRAVNVEVTCIDSEYGFTMLTIRDHYDSTKLAWLTISEDDGRVEVIVKNTTSETERVVTV